MTNAAMMTAGVGLITVLATGPLWAAEHDEKVKKDLFAVITLEGQPCGAVVSFTRQGDADYIAVCQTGDRYHVTMVPEGRVSVKKQ